MEKITPGQVSELIALFAKKLPLTMTKVGAQDWIDHPNDFESSIVEVLTSRSTSVSATLPTTSGSITGLVSELKSALSFPINQVMFKAEDTNLEAAIDLSQRFAKKVFGVEIDLRKLFNFPTELPWKDVMVVFDPGWDNRHVVKKALNGQNLAVWEETDVMKYSGSKRLEQPTLYIIENSITPSADTLGKQAKSPDQLNADGRIYLDLRNYILAFGQRYFGFQDFLDSQTWTWFPKNRLPCGEVAGGLWASHCRSVEFFWNDSSCVDSRMGARLAISVSLKT